MDQDSKKVMKEAIEKILPIVASLKEWEWKRIVSLIDWHYSSKAADVILDGDDIKKLEKSLKWDILGQRPND